MDPVGVYLETYFPGCAKIITVIGVLGFILLFGFLGIWGLSTDNASGVLFLAVALAFTLALARDARTWRRRKVDRIDQDNETSEPDSDASGAVR